jgi:hypothetical protein
MCDPAQVQKLQVTSDPCQNCPAGKGFVSGDGVGGFE